MTNELPKDIGGYQAIENGLTIDGDIWVLAGTPDSFVEVGILVKPALDENSKYGWHIYRRLPVPSNRDDKGIETEISRPEGDFSLGMKPTNPKDAVGSDKIPLHLWPTTATALGSMALLDGMLKYGRTNYRAIGVRSSIYYDATIRHMNAWFEGEDLDPDSGLDHLAHALACIAVLVDAKAAGKLNDDRVYPGDYRKFMTELTPHVKRLKDKHAGKNPRHYSINDLTPSETA